MPLSIEETPLSSLKPYHKNPRQHSKKQIKQLASCIERFQILRPILIDPSNVIIAGHAVVEAANLLGLKTIPTIKAEHLSEEEVRAFRIADNKLAENASWDDAVLKAEFLELSTLQLDFSLSITGFEMSEIDLIIGDSDAEKDDVPLPTLVAGTAVTKVGDLMQLGQHRVLCGDSLNDASYTALMAGELAQCVLTDPPYNVKIDKNVSGLGKHKHREFAMASGEMSFDEFTAFLSTLFKNAIAHSVDGSIHYFFMDWRHLHELMQAAKGLYAELKNICVWVKDNAGMGTFYRSQHEMVMVYKNGTAKHINNFGLGEHRYRTNVWQHAGANSFKGRKETGQNPLSMHPTVKPVGLLSDAIMDCSDRNGIILDPFLGSGSTLIAAEKTGRRCYGIELDPLYVDTTIRRWEQLTGLQAINVATGQTFAQMTETANV